MQSNNPFRVATDEKTPFPDSYYPPPGSPPANLNQGSLSEGQSNGQGSSHHPGQIQAYSLGPYQGQATQQAAWPTYPPPSYPESFPNAIPHQATAPYASQPYITPSAHPGAASQHSIYTPNQGIFHPNSRDPLDPPPPSFSRPIAPHLLQASNPPRGLSQFPGFPPMTLYSNGTTLDKGFPILLPPCLVQPHPFAQRDVMEADWVRFLQDLQLKGRLAGGQRLAAGVLPMAMGVGLIGGLFISRAIEKGMKRRKKEPTAELVDTWNDHFFHARRLHVILAQGPENLSGDVDGPAPDWQNHRSRSLSCSSSSSSSSSSGGHHHGRHDRLMSKEEHRHHRRAERKERKQERRERIHERREERRERKRERRLMKHEKYRLVIHSF